MANQEFKQEGRRQKPDSRSSTFALVRVLRPESFITLAPNDRMMLIVLCVVRKASKAYTSGVVLVYTPNTIFETGDGIRLGPNKLIRVGVIGNFKEEFEWKKLKLNTSQEKRFSRFLKSSWLAFSVGQLEELGTLGSQLLSGVQQGLELLRRPAINRTSKLIENVVETNNTESLRSYFEAGCITTHDGLQSSKKLHTCRVGLDDHLKKVRSLTNELERLLDDVNIALEMENRLCASTVSDEDEDVELNDEEATIPDKKPDANEYALLMGIIKVMVKKDHIMQEKIISGLSLKSSSGELETYRLMWSLRPYIDDEILKRAWKLIP
ncbi:uncharacterized protein LOC111444445 [Cucurbita moschata]|uniref:Uncharacterized protein LOC111444445 n=1 Tax=Cucurbita moschata TaxID=3662 RepID=A0A6J1FDP7_CUCMO|nr:uncharacterized protein LOC111444445 [Cucurbita moschata]